MSDGFVEDYSAVLPIFIYQKQEAAQPVYPDLDKAISKTSMVIDRHSMDIGGIEHCKWIDDTWLVMGEAQFIKGELNQAKQIFDFTRMKYPEPEIKQLSIYWSARVLTEQEQYTRAGDELRKISVDEGFPEKKLGDFYAFKAYFYLKQGKRTEALKELEQSVNYTKKRQVKTRRMFILAQLYDKEGDGVKSNQLYAEVIKRNPVYDMSFYAKINRALAYDVSAGNSQEIRDILYKMIRDSKNAEFLDQIYYALAQLDLTEGNETAAISNLKLATKKSVRNGNAKGLAFYKLGEIYFDKKDYPAAQAYYDSTISFLSTDHPDYQQILALSTSLTQLMRDVDIVKREDSLQKFAALPREEQDKKINMMIEDVKQKELDEERQKQLRQIQSQQAAFDQTSQVNKNINKGEWYFYNPAAVGFGAAEFKKIWGQRANDDNWRREDKSSSLPDYGDIGGETLPEDTIPGANDPKDALYYLKNVPDNYEKLARSDDMIIEALYDLGTIYKEILSDDKMAIVTFEDLISRYDSSKYHANCYYQLYLMFSKDGNISKSEYYKQRVVDDYPGTDYARVIINPNFATQSLAQEKEVQRLYEETYAYFDQKIYRQSFTLAQTGLTEYPNSEYEPQFRFIEAICLGFIHGEAQMIGALELVVKNFKGHEVAKEAQEILDYFNSGKQFVSNETTVEEDETAKEIEKAKANYKYDLGANHNFLIIVPDTANINDLQAVVSDFNRKYFSAKGFKTSNIPLKNGKVMIVVSGVGYANKSMDYSGAFTNAGADTQRITNRSYPYFSISYDNYAYFYKDQNIDGYMAFYNENYLKIK